MLLLLFKCINVFFMIYLQIIEVLVYDSFFQTSLFRVNNIIISPITRYDVKITIEKKWSEKVILVFLSKS